ncbi:DNA primase [uncultured Fusobacterium sp.]|jgi:DNA primase|uniref:DNA primase n=1 Tax=uncultured Fusobacterium sp. TaxID=159267 RepID=UPI0025DB7F09|nr:DNA primase [uncultured Fusobacterium sp.]MCF2640565.1 DNA primase [Fusobacterium varium]
MKYKTEDIDMLIESLKIEEVVGEFVELKKSGSSYKGLCPFHPDTTPSFMVNPSKNICKCFVCGAGGNPVTFYSKYKKISFSEAVEELSKKYSIPIKGIREDSRENENLERYYKIMEDAHSFFQESIFTNSGREALEYLSNRKINPKIIKENRLGYAPNRWSELNDYLINKGHSLNDIIALGLVKESEKGQYDTFRNRIIFPIYSISGKVIAFGGRTLEKDKEIPKYINSPDTPIFKKGRNLYGLERSSIIKKKNYAMLMEGYMDVLSGYLYGFDVTLAPLGTALTEEQGKLLKRYTSNVILAFDSDAPGQSATERAGLILKSLGFNIRVLVLEGAKDPDEFLKTYGKDEFLKSVKNSVEIFDFLFKYYSREYDLSNTMSKQNFINRFKDFFQCIETDLEKSLYLDKLSKQLDIEKEILKETLIDKNKKKSRKFEEVKESSNFIREAAAPLLEELTLALIVKDKNYFQYFKNKNIRGSLTKKIFSYLERNEEDIENLIKEIKDEIELTKSETEEWEIVVCLAINDFSDEEKTQKLLEEIFVSWFRIEIKEQMKNRENLSRFMKIKSIEMQLSRAGNFSKVLDIYKEYEEIINL